MIDEVILAEFFFSADPGDPIPSTQFLHPTHLHISEQAILA
jgi:hypothetical protein